MYLQSIKSVKHNAAKSVNRSILKKSRHIGFGVFIVHSSMIQLEERNSVFRCCSFAANGAYVFCFLSSLPLLPPAIHGSVWVLPVISLILTNTVWPVRACLSIWWERFRGTQKEDEYGLRRLQRNVVYLGRPIAPPLISEPKCGGRGELRGLSPWVQLCTEAQINFGALTPYLTCDGPLRIKSSLFAASPINFGDLTPYLTYDGRLRIKFSLFAASPLLSSSRGRVSRYLLRRRVLGQVAVNGPVLFTRLTRTVKQEMFLQE